MALDSCQPDAMAWAASSMVNSLVEEGLAFLGYPLLSEMAQRPEYRTIVEKLARAMTRKWIKVKAKGKAKKDDKIKRIVEAMERLKVREAFQEAAEHDGFFGRGHIFLDFGDTDDREELKKPIGDGRGDLSKAKIKKGSLRRLKTVEPVWCYPTGYNSSDPLHQDWFKPTSWWVQGKEVHASRLLTFVGREVPDLLKPSYSFGGLSMTQIAKPYVDNWLETRQSVNDIISAFSVFVLKTNLSESLMANDGEGLFRRADLFNRLRDNRGLMMIDKEQEEFANVSAPLSGLDKLQAQAQEHMASVSGIPIVELLGIQPAGLNASSEGEIRTFEAAVKAGQEKLFRPNLDVIFAIVQLSEFGEVDPDIIYEFIPLREMDEKQQAEINNIEANTDAVLVDAGILYPEEARRRIAEDPDTPYHGLDPDDVPMPDLGEGTPDDGDGGGEEDEPPRRSPPRQRITTV